MRSIYEKAGLFYLGKEIDLSTKEQTDTLTLLKNKHFTTHAVIIGMTGSGKTGLGVSLIEESAIDNIPVIAIDPKGDIGNVCMVDHTFSADRFAPWVEDEAKQAGKEVMAYADSKAQMWKEGIASWHQDVDRVRRFEAIDKTIYTPGGSAGVGLNLIGSLEPPSLDVIEDPETFGVYIQNHVSALLSLVGHTATDHTDRSYVLMGKILSHAWMQDQTLSIESLVAKIIDPGFETIGVLPLERFYPQEERFELASKFNTLIASTKYALWRKGEKLDIDALLYDQNGKAKVSIFSIAHLNDEERMFFVTLLLNRIVAWMRRQSGTQALRMMLYMDEVYGFFPPTKNPPSKDPMMLLLKQARAYGVGVVLSTQNPVDLDYKGLSNIGTWFIGRLQTKQDISKVIEALASKNTHALEKKEIEHILSGLSKRTFFIQSAHLEKIRLFHTRWVLSYLKGPLRGEEIKALMAHKKKPASIKTATKMPYQASTTLAQPVDAKIEQYFEPPIGSREYRPFLGVKAVLHYIDGRRGIDAIEEKTLLLLLDANANSPDWEEAVEESISFERFLTTKPQQAQFGALPLFATQYKEFQAGCKKLKSHLYQAYPLLLWRCKKPQLLSNPFESKEAFVARLKGVLDELKEQEIEKVSNRFAKKERRLLERLERAHERVEKEKADATGSLIDTGIAILGALFGRASSRKIGTAVRKGSKAFKERSDIERARLRIEALEEELALLQEELEEAIDRIDEAYAIDRAEIEEIRLRPRKSEIDIQKCALVWRL